VRGILGIDVAKASLDVALLIDEQKADHAPFSNDAQGFKQLVRWLEHRGVDGVHSCLEATDSFGEGVATFLHEQGNTVSVVNPARISGYAKSQLSRDCRIYCVNGSDTNTTIKINDQIVQDFRPLRNGHGPLGNNVAMGQVE
jgi:transposase